MVSDFRGKVTLSACYLPGSSSSTPYLWVRPGDQGGEFRRQPGTGTLHLGFAISPDGRWAAGYYRAWDDPKLDAVTIYDRTGGGAGLKVYRTIQPPEPGTRLEIARWSPDGRRLLIQVLRNGVQSILGLGFLLVSPFERGDAGRYIKVADRRPWVWLPDGSGIAVNSSTASNDLPPDVDIVDLQGRMVYQFPRAGALANWAYGAFDPAGALLLTELPDNRLAVYGYHPTDPTGKLRHLYERMLPPPPTTPYFRPDVGWYDTDHLVTHHETAEGSRVIVFSATSRYEDRWVEEDVTQTLIQDPSNEVRVDLSVSAY